MHKKLENLVFMNSKKFGTQKVKQLLTTCRVTTELNILPVVKVMSLMDGVHLLIARHFRYELRRGEKIFSSKFGAREVYIAPHVIS